LTTGITISELRSVIDEKVPGAVSHFDESSIWVQPQMLSEVCSTLKDPEHLDLSYLTSITAVDYVEYFELVYHLLSMRTNRSAVIKSKCSGRQSLSVPSVSHIWKGADLQEREIWDLMGITFEGHPNLKRILLWEGFDGHPLRKDYLG